LLRRLFRSAAGRTADPSAAGESPGARRFQDRVARDLSAQDFPDQDLAGFRDPATLSGPRNRSPIAHFSIAVRPARDFREFANQAIQTFALLTTEADSSRAGPMLVP